MARRNSGSGRKEPFFHDEELEAEALLMLTEFGNSCEAVSAPPVPIDDIAAYLQLVVEYKDLAAEYPETEVLGEMWFNERKIVIHEGLVPEEFPTMLGRYRFTLAHEVGHWRLHRQLYLRQPGEQDMFRGPAKPDRLQRSKPYDPKEVQANRFASFILMPRDVVKREWFSWHGDADPIYVEDLRAPGEDDWLDDQLAEREIRPFAQIFEVSPLAMRIRLEGLKLLMPEREPNLFDGG